MAVIIDGQDPGKNASDTASGGNGAFDTNGVLPKKPIKDNNNNNNNGSAKSLAAASPGGSWLRRQVFLPLMAFLNTPPYTQMLSMVAYGAAVVCFEKLRPALALYGVHCLTDATPRRLQKPRYIARIQNWCNNAYVFRWMAEYFPCRLHATASITASDGPCIFLYHPHGVIGMGGIMALVTNACGFDVVFPGLVRSAVTLNAVFRIPFFREWCMVNGFCSADKQTLAGRLAAGESIILVPGGAREALVAHPKTMKLLLNKRRGFVRLALESGVPLVPVLGIGENDVFDTFVATADGDVGTTARHWIRKLQDRFLAIFSFSPPIWTNFLPNRTPIDVVVGSPVRFDKNSSVDDCHALYIKALRDLYEEHKDAYGYGDVPLEML